MRNDVIDGIKNNLPAILFERDMSIRDLERETGIPYASIHAIVNNDKKGIMFHQLATICKTLGLNVGDVYELAADD